MGCPIKDILPFFRAKAKVSLRTQGYIVPFLGLQENGQCHLEPLYLENNAAKDALMRRLQEGIAAGKIKELFLLAEAWLVSDDTPAGIAWLKEHGSLENYPGKKEVIALTYCNADEEIVYSCQIERHGESVEAGEWTHRGAVVADGIQGSQRFGDMFRQANARNN